MEKWLETTVLDQAFALQWVQDNIASFNGDPNNVMVFGQSAGGMSAGFHVTSPISKGNLHSAIIMSGPPDVAFWQPKAVANQWAIDWVEKAGCTGTNEQIRTCLRSLKRDQLMEHKIPHPSNLSLLYPLGWMPHVDGYYMTDTPVGMVNAGVWNKVPTMFGVEKNEGTMFVLAAPMVVPGSVPLTWEHGFKGICQQIFPFNSTKQTVVYNHFKKEDHLAAKAAETIFTDGVIRCGTRRMMRAIANQNLPEAPTYYYFTDFANYLMGLYNTLGDFHGMDLIHVFEFDTIATQVWTPYDTELGKYLRRSFYEFATHGAPGDNNWKQYTIEEEKGIYMDTEHKPQNLNYNDHECDFWDSLGANLWEGKYDF